jgi:serine/threonine protein kinase
MAARADTSTRRPSDVRFSELPSSIEQLPSLHLLDLSERVSQIADRILRHVKDPFPIEQASAKLDMVLHEEELIKASLRPTDPSSDESISKACAYVRDPLKILTRSQISLVPNTVVSIPRNTRNFVLMTLEESTLKQEPFKAIKELGSGYYGRVDLVETKIGLFALKHPLLRDRSAQLKTEISLLSAEASYLMSFTPHPNIINVEAISYGKIFLEVAREGSLMKMLTSPDLTEELIRKYALDVVEALLHIHAKGCTYKDLKPENVLISEGIAKLCDFGLTTPTSTDKDMRGTADYIAPELSLGIFSQKADVWSLGILLFNMITGKESIYDYESQKETQSDHYQRIALMTRNKPCNEEVVFRGVNKKLMEERDPKGIIRRLITQCLHGDPEQRIALVEVKEALKAAKIASNPPSELELNAISADHN